MSELWLRLMGESSNCRSSWENISYTFLSGFNSKLHRKSLRLLERQLLPRFTIPGALMPPAMHTRLIWLASAVKIPSHSYYRITQHLEPLLPMMIRNHIFSKYIFEKYYPHSRTKNRENFHGFHDG